MTLQAAAAALDAMALGQEPAREDVISGALCLQTLGFKGDADRDLLDAAAGLEAVATGRPLHLDDAGRARAAVLAKVVRDFATKQSLP